MFVILARVSVSQSISVLIKQTSIVIWLVLMRLNELIHPVLHNWCNKGRDICYPVCGMVNIIFFSFVANYKWRQWDPSLIISAVLNHLSEAI